MVGAPAPPGRASVDPPPHPRIRGPRLRGLEPTAPRVADRWPSLRSWPLWPEPGRRCRTAREPGSARSAWPVRPRSAAPGPARWRSASPGPPRPTDPGWPRPLEAELGLSHAPAVEPGRPRSRSVQVGSLRSPGLLRLFGWPAARPSGRSRPSLGRRLSQRSGRCEGLPAQRLRAPFPAEPPAVVVAPPLDLLAAAPRLPSGGAAGTCRGGTSTGPRRFAMLSASLRVAAAGARLPSTGPARTPTRFGKAGPVGFLRRSVALRVARQHGHAIEDAIGAREVAWARVHFGINDETFGRLSAGDRVSMITTVPLPPNCTELGGSDARAAAYFRTFAGREQRRPGASSGAQARG